MKSEAIHNNLPPVIRVFLSSTFADMEKERSYFNEVLVPKFNRLCSERGISFFSVDLRWGITEEEQINGQVLPICLSEIDRCRPFFIGILGNRYGSIMESVSPHIVNSIPWLSGKEGCSITELEMLYAVLDQEKNDSVKNCAFFLRSNELSAQWYGTSEEIPQLTALKNRISSDDNIPSSEYDSLEEFGRLVEANILQWLDNEFPLPDKVNEVRRAWYDRELLRGYIDIPELNRFLDSYFAESDRSLLFYGDGACGKTTFLTAWHPRDGHKILINCGSDDIFLYWPSIARQIITEINSINSECGMPAFKPGASFMFQLMQMNHDRKNNGYIQRLSTDFYFVTDEEREDFRTAFLAWLEKLPLKEPVYIIINDLNLLEDESSHMLSWLPSSACGQVRFVCSTNDDEMVSNAENLSWNCKKMPGFPKENARELIHNYLHIYGKNLAPNQLQNLLESPVSIYPGQLRFMVDFLINNGRFENLSFLISGLASQSEPQSVYCYIHDYSTQSLTDRERRAVATVFALLRYSQMSLNEQECFRLAELHTGVTTMEWAQIRGVFDAFGLIKGDYWNMREEEQQKFVDSLLPSEERSAIQELLGDDMLQHLHTFDQNHGSLQRIRENTAYAKAAIHHYQHCKNWDKLHKTLLDSSVLYYLSKLDWQVVRAAWVELFLHSDIDIPASLYALLEQYRKKQGDDLQIALYTAGLFKDLEQHNHLNRVYELMGTDQIPGSLNMDLNRVSPDFADLYNAINELKRSRQFQKLYIQVKHLLSSENQFSPIERCQLLFFKADAESNIQLYHEFLNTSNTYYEEAILASSIYDMRRALSLRGDALYRLGRYSDAAAVQQQVSRLSLCDGDLRAYLASRNVLAMCLYKNEKYAEAIAEYDILHRYWTKLGNVRETCTVLLNKCNALSFSGDYRAALETARAARDQLPTDQKNLAGLRASFLSNMGAYAMQMELYSEAENYLLQSIAEAEALEQNSTIIRSNYSLIQIYNQTDQFMKAVERYTVQLELLWAHQEYAALTRALREAMNLLLSNKYTSMAKDLEARWEERFAQMPGGKEFFDKQARAGVSDSQTIARKKEQLAMVRSEGDPGKIAHACYDLANELSSADKEQALKILLEAASLFRQCGQENKTRTCLEEALILLFDKGRPHNKELYELTINHVTDPTIRRIAFLWEQIGDSQLPSVSTGGKKHFLFNRKSGKDAKNTKSASVPEMLEELVTYDGVYEKLVLRCLVDIVDQIINQCTAPQIIQLVHALNESNAKILSFRLDGAMLKDNQKDIQALTKDYHSPMALEKLAYYEKCMEVLEVLQSTNIAAVAGNLAIIYRRRKDQDKTIRYHTLSTTLYKKNGNIRDYLIETMNTATAHDQFGQQQQAVSLLRVGIEEAASAGEQRLEASMAGNLASILSRIGDPADHEEVLRCFSIEEQYFRNARSHRDLVISLLNQIIYLNETANYDVWRDKLAEAGKLIRAYHFREFEKTLAKLEWLAKSSRTNCETITANQAETDLRQLLLAEDVYEMNSLKEENGVFCALCRPKTPSQTELEQLQLFLDPSVPNQVDAIFLCRPNLASTSAVPQIQKFVEWWNSQGEYHLRLFADDMVLRATCRIQAAEWQDIIVRFKRVRKLWEADRACLSMMCIGMNDLPLFQGLKLKILNDDQ